MAVALLQMVCRNLVGVVPTKDPILSRTALLAMFATRLQRVQPIAMGWTPPSFVQCGQSCYEKEGSYVHGDVPRQHKVGESCEGNQQRLATKPNRAADQVLEVFGQETIGASCQTHGEGLDSWATSCSATTEGDCSSLSWGGNGKFMSGWAAMVAPSS